MLRRGEPIAVGLAARIAAEVATGISFLHGNGVMHRDIKPSNVLLNEQHEGRLGDFGLAARLPDDGQRLRTRARACARSRSRSRTSTARQTPRQYCTRASPSAEAEA